MAHSDGQRRSLSKGLRFEIFKRDGFRCRYCGATPLQSALQVDHVVPVVDGGADDPANLLTACQPCNIGKGSRRLEACKLEQPTDVEILRDQIEQIKEYLRVQNELDSVIYEHVKELEKIWEREIGPLSDKMFRRFRLLVTQEPMDLLVDVVRIVGSAATSPARPGAPFIPSRALDQQKYFYGVLRNVKANRSRSAEGVGGGLSSDPDCGDGGDGSSVRNSDARAQERDESVLEKRAAADFAAGLRAVAKAPGSRRIADRPRGA